MKPDMSGVELELAESFEPNSDLTEWTIRLRPGVTFHNGKALTADDVMYTIRRVASDPAQSANILCAPLDVKNMTKVDALTLRIPTKWPIAALEEWFCTDYGWGILPDGMKDFSHPVGTGPFMFESFRPGQFSVQKRNPNYWKEGQPYLDKLVLRSLPDPNARLSALQTGQLDAYEGMTFVQAKEQYAAKTVNILNSPSAAFVGITMAVNLKPFTDSRVREAFKLIADRPALMEQVQLGYGEIGNDMFGKKGMQFYPEDIPQRQQDIERAKSLLAAAGANNLAITLYSSTVGPGMLDSATVFAQQAKAAGVSINVNNSPADTYFTDKYMKVNFGQTYAGPFPYSVWYQLQLVTGAVWDETHWGDPTWDRLVREAQGERDLTAAKDKWHALQKTIWDRGGYLIWGTLPYLDGLGKNVQGLSQNAFMPLGGCDFAKVWLQ